MEKANKTKYGEHDREDEDIHISGLGLEGQD